jgi:hypothetical protein
VCVVLITPPPPPAPHYTLLVCVALQDIDWAISAKVDFIAVSFVRTADVIHNLRSYIQTRVEAQEQQEGDKGGVGWEGATSTGVGGGGTGASWSGGQPCTFIQTRVEAQDHQEGG